MVCWTWSLPEIICLWMGRGVCMTAGWYCQQHPPHLPPLRGREGEHEMIKFITMASHNWHRVKLPTQQATVKAIWNTINHAAWYTTVLLLLRNKSSLVNNLPLLSWLCLSYRNRFFVVMHQRKKPKAIFPPSLKFHLMQDLQQKLYKCYNSYYAPFWVFLTSDACEAMYIAAAAIERYTRLQAKGHNSTMDISFHFRGSLTLELNQAVLPSLQCD